MQIAANARAAALGTLLAAALPSMAEEPREIVERPPVPIQMPADIVAPELATFLSGAALVGGLAWGTLLFTSTSAAGSQPYLPAFAVVGTTLVIAPSLGRWLGGDFRRAAMHTGTRLLIGGGAFAAAYYGFSEASGGPHPVSIAVFGLLTPIVIAEGLMDIGATSRDLRLDRAVQVIAVAPRRGGTVATVAVSF